MMEWLLCCSVAAWDASLGRGGKAASDISTQQTCSTYTDNGAVEVVVVVVVGISFAMWKPKEKERKKELCKKLSSSTIFVCCIDGLTQLYITPHVTDKHKERNEQTNRWRRKTKTKRGWRWTDTYRRKRRIKCPVCIVVHLAGAIQLWIGEERMWVRKK
jgi:hypothetical protein